MDPTKIRPKRDWVLVHCDPRKEMIGLIALPPSETGIEKVTERAGTVLAVGPGEKGKVLGLVKDDRIVFRGFLKHASPVPTDDGEEYFLMSIDDILAVVPVGVDVGVFSSRPSQSAVESVSASGEVRMR
jgi:co-chaperonin GroES (HSP10)